MTVDEIVARFAASLSEEQRASLKSAIEDKIFAERQDAFGDGYSAASEEAERTAN